MEYVLVKFEQAREVWVDGAPNGHTNALLQVAAGIHSFELAPPADYTPATQMETLDDGSTSALAPCVIEFDRA
jgi:hypothetical protein